MGKASVENIRATAFPSWKPIDESTDLFLRRRTTHG